MLAQLDPEFSVATIGTRFHYEIGGIAGSGVPPLPPHWATRDLPKEQPRPRPPPPGPPTHLMPKSWTGALTKEKETP